TAIAEELLNDIDKETVDFGDNFDASHQEPSVLPAKLPNLLLNGAEGIAVGMATKIPPHNLTELCDGISYLLDHPHSGIDELKRDARPTAVLNQLYKHTALQTAFNVNMVAVVGQQPQVITLKSALQHYIDYRAEVVTRRARYDLRRARERAHVLDGLVIALD